MRFLDLAWIGPSLLLVAACGGSGETPGAGGTGGGTGGAVATTTTTIPTATTSNSTGTGGDKGMPSDVYPAPHADPPEVVSAGGPVLASPKIVPVFFANELPETASSVEDFEKRIGSTQYWAATTAEYGVGPATALPAIHLGEVPEGIIDDEEIQAWLGSKLNGDDPAWPAADGDTVYVLHYPEGTTITAFDDESCLGFGGYHSNIKLDAAHGSRHVAYAVIPYCGGFAGFDGVDGLTAVVSHELIEAASDPYPMSDPAYSSVDDANLYWAFALGGGENADMCAQQEGAFTLFDEIPYVVQRSWSNVSAKAGHDPCVPAIPGEAYFNAAPDLPDTVKLHLPGHTVSMKGIRVPVGQTKTVEVRLFSDGDTGGPWGVDVNDFTWVLGASGSLDLSLDRVGGENGEKLYLTITVYDPSPYFIELFQLLSYKDGVRHEWFGVIGN